MELLFLNFKDLDPQHSKQRSCVLAQHPFDSKIKPLSNFNHTVNLQFDFNFYRLIVNPTNQVVGTAYTFEADIMNVS